MQELQVSQNFEQLLILTAQVKPGFNALLMQAEGTFTLFPELPAEIRLRIWRAALPALELSSSTGITLT